MNADAEITHRESLIRVMLNAASDERLKRGDRAEAKRLAGILSMIQLYNAREAGHAFAQTDRA